jgi:hypothetical protein
MMHTPPAATALALALALGACATSPSSKGAPMPTGEKSDLEAVQAAVAGVPHFLDRKRWPELRALYAETVQTDYRSLFGGDVQSQPGKALVEGWRKLLDPIVTQHLLGPIEVTLQGTSATASCHVRAYHVAKGLPAGDTWMVAGHYVFDLEKAGSAWRIRGMKLETLYQTGNLQLLQQVAGSSR